MNSSMEFEYRGALDNKNCALDNKELYELIPVLSHHAAKIIPLLHSYSTWNEIEGAINIGNDGEQFLPENMTRIPVPGMIHARPYKLIHSFSVSDEFKSSELALSSTLSLLNVIFNAVRKGYLPSKTLVNHHGTNVLALITASPGT